jgi:uncharacterized BrkB/YihY/UPF0761 family membrane protein
MPDEPSDTADPPPPSNDDERRIRDRLVDARLKAEGYRTEALTRFDQERSRRTWVQIGYEAWNMDRQRGGPLLSGGLAYRVFIWMVPFALLLASILMLVAEASDRRIEDLAKNVGITGAMVGAVGEAARSTGSSAWWLAFLGLVLSLWAARGLARAIMIVSRIAWALPPSAGRAGTRAGLATWGLFVAGLSIQFIRPLLFRGGVTSDLLAQVILLGLTSAVVIVGLALAPHRGPWTNVLVGGFLLAIGLRGMGIATAVYFGPELVEKQSLYGGLGMAIVILLFLFLCCRLLVWGQFLNARVAGVRISDAVPTQLAEAVAFDALDEGQRS